MPGIAMTFSATACSVTLSKARYTIPTPPRPTSRSTTNRPPRTSCLGYAGTVMPCLPAPALADDEDLVAHASCPLRANELLAREVLANFGARSREVFAHE